MKKLLFSLSLVGALAAFAGESEIDASAQIFGVLPITSGETNVIVSVPWVAATNESALTIPVADIIKTANLTAGDWVRVWNTEQKAFNVWTLTEDSGTGIKSWVKGTTVHPEGITEGSGSDVTELARGNALILHRSNPKDASGNPNTFYLYGQYIGSPAGTTTTCVIGSASTPAYTLLAPPYTASSNVKDLNWSNVGTNDFLTISINSKSQMIGRNKANNQWGDFISAVKKNKSTGKLEKTEQWVETSATIPAGTGFWYVSRAGGATAPQVEW